MLFCIIQRHATPSKSRKGDSRYVAAGPVEYLGLDRVAHFVSGESDRGINSFLTAAIEYVRPLARTLIARETTGQICTQGRALKPGDL
jgi:hypothetical protein